MSIDVLAENRHTSSRLPILFGRAGNLGNGDTTPRLIRPGGGCVR